MLKALRNRIPLGWLQLKHDKFRLLTAISGIAFADILIFMKIYKSSKRILTASFIILSCRFRKIK